jgi:hypothetical protein
VHGKEFEDSGRRCESLAYYHRRGPLGEIFEEFDKKEPASRVAVIGLGSGAMATYATPGQEWTFYEINPAVVAIAQNPKYFSYLNDCTHAPIRIVLGDARLKPQDAPDGQYSLIVLDAFSSDAIPVHLITREAIRLYLSKLTPEGMPAFHISNRTMDLGRVLSGLAGSESLSGFIYSDKVRETAIGKDPSQWAVMARSENTLGGLARNPHWKPLSAEPRSVVWTDDFSNILHVLKWRHESRFWILGL